MFRTENTHKTASSYLQSRQQSSTTTTILPKDTYIHLNTHTRVLRITRCMYFKVCRLLVKTRTQAQTEVRTYHDFDFQLLLLFFLLPARSEQKEEVVPPSKFCQLRRWCRSLRRPPNRRAAGLTIVIVTSWLIRRIDCLVDCHPYYCITVLQS